MQYIPDYQPPFLFRSGHVNTIYPTLFRNVKLPEPMRERIHTPDNDFLDLDWYDQESSTLVIVLHGLEGNSDRAYIKGMVKTVLRAGWDAMAWNFRGCSGELNKQPFFYHIGFSVDLDTVVRHVISTRKYEKIALVGSSMGGNILLKYLGESTFKPLPPQLKTAVAYSVPTDLQTSSIKLDSWKNTIYMRRFIKKLIKKIKAKSEIYPDLIDATGAEKIRSFKEFDNRYTAPLNGFKDAEDYWQQNSSKQFIPNIEIPTLIFNAADDSFLTPQCHPIEEAQMNPHVTFELIKHGGHVGFVLFNEQDEYWSEKRTITYLKQVIKSGC